MVILPALLLGSSLLTVILIFCFLLSTSISSLLNFASLCFFVLLSFENLLCFGVVRGIETSLPRSEEKLKPGAQLCLELSVKCVGLAGVRVLLGACVFLLRCVNAFLLILEPPTTPARC